MKPVSVFMVAGKPGYLMKMGNFKCWACGKEFTASPRKMWGYKSCGCIRTKHGQIDHPLHTVWVSMRQRCTNPNEPAWKDYGGRGIAVCDEWNEFKTFFKWALASGWQPGLTVERKDNYKGYSPSNCCFATMATQQHNRRDNAFTPALVKVLRERFSNGERQCDLAREFGLNPGSVWHVVHNKIWKEL